VHIDELARLAGCDPDTVRYYEGLGLIAGAGADDDRTYRDADVERMRVIVRGRSLGLDVEGIRGLLATSTRPRREVPSGPLIRKGRLRSGQ